MHLAYSAVSEELTSLANGPELKRLLFVSGNRTHNRYSANIIPGDLYTEIYENYRERGWKLMESTAGQLELFTVDSHVNLFQSPGNNLARKMTATSGRKCLELSRKSGPIGLLEKMLLTSEEWHSTTQYLTWKVLATPSGRLLFQLVPSEPTTGGTGSSLLPTPVARDWKGYTARETESRCNYLRSLFPGTSGKPHPEYYEEVMGFPIGRTALKSLETP